MPNVNWQTDWDRNITSMLQYQYHQRHLPQIVENQ